MTSGLQQLADQVAALVGPPSMGEGFGNPVNSLFQAGNTVFINSQGLFVYAGTPGLGNLILSIAPSGGTDPFGNVFPQGLNVTAGAITGTTITGTTITGSVISGSTFTGTDFVLNSAGEFFYSGAPALGNMVASVAASAGTDPFGNPYARGIEVHSGGLVLDNQAGSPSVAGASAFFSDSNGRPRYLSQAGNNSIIDRSLVNVARFTVGNSTAPGVISAVMSYSGGESNQSSEFEVEITGIATMAAAALQNLFFELYIDGAPTSPQTVVHASPSGWAGSQNICYTLRFIISFLGTGPAATAICTGTGIMNLGGQGGPGNTVGLNTGPGTGAPVPVDSGVNHTFQVMAYWSNASAGQALTTYRTRECRRN